MKFKVTFENGKNIEFKSTKEFDLGRTTEYLDGQNQKLTYHDRSSMWEFEGEEGKMVVKEVEMF